jgi:hypothetical protein
MGVEYDYITPVILSSAISPTWTIFQATLYTHLPYPFVSLRNNLIWLGLLEHLYVFSEEVMAGATCCNLGAR